ncbi:MAG: hypothetical protein ABIW38_13995 [Ferruginibacter sp.]
MSVSFTSKVTCCSKSFSCYHFIFLLIIASCYSCTGTTGSKELAGKQEQLEKKVYQKPTSGFTDSIIINFPAAVFYNPDSLQLQKIKAVTDAGVFESTMHDCFYQQRNAHRVLKAYYPRIKIIEITQARYLVFKSAKAVLATIDLDTKYDPCGMFIFDQLKAPIFVDMTNVDTQLGFYFSK